MGLPSSQLPSHLQMNYWGLERRPLTGLKRQYPIRYRCSQRRKRAQLRAYYEVGSFTISKTKVTRSSLLLGDRGCPAPPLCETMGTKAPISLGN